MNKKQNKLLISISIVAFFLLISFNSPIQPLGSTNISDMNNETINNEKNKEKEINTEIKSSASPINPANYDVSGSGTDFTVTASYEEDLTFSGASKNIVSGTEEGSYSYTYINSNNAVGDGTYYARDTLIQEYEAHSLGCSLVSGDSMMSDPDWTTGSVAGDVQTDDNNRVRILGPSIGGLVHLQGKITGYDDPFTATTHAGIESIYINVRVWCDTQLFGIDQTQYIRFRAICDDATTSVWEDIVYNPIGNVDYGEQVTVTSSVWSNIFSRVAAGGYISELEFDMYHDEEGTNGNVYCMIDEAEIYYRHYDYQICVDYTLDYGAGRFPTSDFSEFDSMDIVLDYIDTTPGVQAYIYNHVSYGWTSIGSFTSTWNSEIETGTISSNPSNYISSNRYIVFRFSTYNAFGIEYAPTQKHLDIDYIGITFKSSIVTTGSYEYFYNFSSTNPQYSAEFSTRNWFTITPYQVTISKPSLYSLDKIYDPSDGDQTSNVNKANGQEGDGNIILQNFDSSWPGVGTYQIIFNASNILDFSKLSIQKTMGYNQFLINYVDENNIDIDISHGEFINITSIVNNSFSAMIIEDLDYVFYNSTAIGISGSLTYNNPEFNLYSEIPLSMIGTYGLNLSVSILTLGKIKYVGYYYQSEVMNVVSKIDIEESYRTYDGILTYNDNTEKLLYEFDLENGDLNTDAAVIFINYTDNPEIYPDTTKEIEITGCISNDIELKKLYYNTSILTLNDGINFTLNFEYIGVGTDADLNILEIALVPRIEDGLSHNKYIYLNKSFSLVNIESGSPENITIQINPQDLLDTGNIGTFLTVYDIYIEFMENGQSSCSSKLRDMNIIPFEEYIPDACVWNISYINNTIPTGNLLEVDAPLINVNDCMVLVYATKMNYTDASGFYGYFGMDLPTFNMTLPLNRSYNSISYFKESSFNLIVNSSLLPDRDIRDYAFYQINDTELDTIEIDWTPIYYDHEDYDDYFKVFDFTVDINTLIDGNYTVYVKLVDHIQQFTIHSFNITVDRTDTLITPDNFIDGGYLSNVYDILDFSVFDLYHIPASLNYSLDGGSTNITAWASSYTIDVTGLDEIVYIDIWANDYADNYVHYLFSVSVDNTDPNIMAGNFVNDTLLVDYANIEILMTDTNLNNDSARYRVNGGTIEYFGSWPFLIDVSTANEELTIEVWVEDLCNNGNTSTYVAMFNVKAPDLAFIIDTKETISLYPLHVEFLAEDSTLATVKLELFDSNNILLETYYKVTGVNVTSGVANEFILINLVNGSSYSINLTAWDESGLLTKISWNSFNLAYDTFSLRSGINQLYWYDANGYLRLEISAELSTMTGELRMAWQRGIPEVKSRFFQFFQLYVEEGSFVGEISIVYHFTDLELGQIGRAKQYLEVFYYDILDGNWHLIDSDIDLNENTISFSYDAKYQYLVVAEFRSIWTYWYTYAGIIGAVLGAVVGFVVYRKKTEESRLIRNFSDIGETKADKQRRKKAEKRTFEEIELDEEETRRKQRQSQIEKDAEMFNKYKSGIDEEDEEEISTVKMDIIRDKFSSSVSEPKESTSNIQVKSATEPVNPDIDQIMKKSIISKQIPIDNKLSVSTKIENLQCKVHKGTIEGPIYYCPKCKATYCAQCINTLVENEDKCWSCGENIAMLPETGKPILVDQKEAKIEIEDNNQPIKEEEIDTETKTTDSVPKIEIESFEVQAKPDSEYSIQYNAIKEELNGFKPLMNDLDIALKEGKINQDQYNYQKSVYKAKYDEKRLEGQNFAAKLKVERIKEKDIARKGRIYTSLINNKTNIPIYQSPYEKLKLHLMEKIEITNYLTNLTVQPNIVSYKGLKIKGEEVYLMMYNESKYVRVIQLFDCHPEKSVELIITKLCNWADSNFGQIETQPQSIQQALDKLFQ